MERSDLIEIINGFASAGKVFSNEQDFQFELAQELKNRNDVEEVKLEVLSFQSDVPNLNGNLRNLINRRNGSLEVTRSEKEYTDIILRTTDGRCYAIELKLKAANNPYLYRSGAFGDVVVMRQGAEDINAYYFLNDIVRLEGINERIFPRQIHIEKSFAILLTNYKKYRESDFRGSQIWYEFPINNGREINDSTLTVHDVNNTGSYNKYIPLRLRGNYCFEWNDYNLNPAPVNLLDAQLPVPPQFSFLVVEVQPQKINQVERKETVKIIMQ